MDNHPTFRLGVKGYQHDVRTISLRDVVKADLLPANYPTKARGLIDMFTDWRMLGNDGAGDCVIATIGHFIMAWSGGKIMPTQDMCLQLYYQLTGGPDTGLYVLDTLKKWRQNAWLGAPPILGFATIHPTDNEMIRHAIAAFGGVFNAIALPKTAQAQTGSVWEYTGSLTGDAAPWSWGGHATPSMAWDRSADEEEEITWGARQRMTAHFRAAYCMELYAVIPAVPPPWFDKQRFLGYLADVGAVQP